MPSTRAITARRLGAIALALATAFATLAMGLWDEAAGGKDFDFKKVEKCFMRKINNKREHNGLGRLEKDKHLGYVARRHAKWMARADRVKHDSDIGEKVTKWIVLGQNTGKGKRCKSMFTSFWNSSGHRANILGSWRFLGVGTKFEKGRLYVQQVFESTDNPGNVWSVP